MTSGAIATIQLTGLFISPGHNYVGHHGRPPGEQPIVAVDRVECVAGRGLRGDRYFDHQPDFRGQITFFSMDVFEALARELGPARWPGLSSRAATSSPGSSTSIRSSGPSSRSRVCDSQAPRSADRAT